MAPIDFIPYKNGQKLSYAQYGDPAGYPVLVQHGLIASIRSGHIFRCLLDAGARLICAARPGYGASSPYEMKNVAEWGEIVANLVDELNLRRFDVLGISSGAPYSYAIGYHLPAKVRNIFILSGTPALYDGSVAAAWPYPIDPNARLDELQSLAYNLFFANLSEESKGEQDIRDSMNNDCFGVALDLKIRCLDWGFRLQDVRSRVIMRHSRADESVPLVTAQRTSQLLPNCQLEIRERDVHFSQDVLDLFIKTVMAKPHGHDPM